MRDRFPDRCAKCGGRLFSVSSQAPAMRVVTCASCRDQTVLPVIADSWQMNEEELRRLIHRPGGKHGLHP